MDEKYEVLLTGDSSGQVLLNLVKSFVFDETDGLFAMVYRQ